MPISVKNAVIYPYTIEHTGLIRNMKNLHFQNIIPVSPIGYRYNNVDAGQIDKGLKTGIFVREDFEASIDNVTDVIITKNDTDSIEKLFYSIEHGKNVSCFVPLGELENEVILRCNKNSVSYHNYSNYSWNVASMGEKKLSKIDVPIILVCGMSERTQKFDIQLHIGSRLKNLGYKVSQIGSRPYSTVCSMHNFPEYVLGVHPEYDKLVYFNRFIKTIEVKEQPDIMVIGIPGGTVPYDMSHNNQYGILAYIVCQAIPVDFSILSMAYNHYDSKFYDFICPYMQYRYGFEIDLFHLSNVYHDLDVNGGEDTIIMDQSSLMKKKKELEFESYHIFQDEDVIIKKLLDKLGGE